MALTLTEIQAATDAYVEATPYDIYFKGNILLYKLLGGEMGGNTIPGGKTLDVMIEHDEANTGSYGNATSLTLTKKEVFNRASYRWAAYYAALTIDLDDVRMNNGDLAVVNLVEGKMKNAQKSIRNLMGSEIYGAASDGDSFLGLGDLFLATTTTPYGGIQEADMAEWAANNDATAAAIGFTFLQSMRQTASIDDNMEGKPNLYLTTEVLKDSFEASLHVQARYSDVNLVNAGFDNILFGGAPVVSDNKQAAGTVDALNTNFLDIWTHEDFNFTKPVWAAAVATPDLKTSAIKWSGQLICKNRKAHARRTGITVAA
jgi:hypothetical protein